MPTRLTNTATGSSRSLCDRFRCRPEFAAGLVQQASPQREELSGVDENAAKEAVKGHSVPGSIFGGAYDALKDAVITEEGVRLPFDLDEVIECLRFERYIRRDQQRPFGGSNILHKMYYAVRPFLLTRLRRVLQYYSFRGWQSLQFPTWPVDTSVENILAAVMVRLLEFSANREEPFIWFWPRGAPATVMMTHDVETEAGLRFLPRLMDLNDNYAVTAAVQLVPEQRYDVSELVRRLIRDRGFELGVQDFNHDGHLFDSEPMFQSRVAHINAYARAWGATGFRSGALYRNQAWCSALDFEYDMSVPNVGHLEAQRGGCCTVFPYFNGSLLELPLTTTQDYTLFNILRQWSTELWVQQIERILEHSGLVSFIVHPDYIRHSREQKVYSQLLEIVCELRSTRGVWVARPSEVNRWWRDRAQSHLVRDGKAWKVSGPASGRATVAYARAESDRLIYWLQTPS